MPEHLLPSFNWKLESTTHFYHHKTPTTQSHDDKVKEVKSTRYIIQSLPSPLTFYLVCTAMTTSFTTQPQRSLKRPRRNVSFEEEETGDRRQVKRRVIEITSVLDLAEKGDLWVQPSDVTETIASLRQEGKAWRESSLFPKYVDALAETFCLYSSGQANIMPSPSQVAALSTGLARGAESSALPELAVARHQQRRIAIASVVQVGRLVRATENMDAIVANVAEQLSKSAQAFAQALGAADAVFVEQQQHEQATTILPVPKRIADTKVGQIAQAGIRAVLTSVA